MHFHFLRDLVVVFAIAGIVVYALRLIRVPPLIGLLLAGAVIGPHGLSLIADAENVEVLAEIGVVLLLFTIGIEFSLGQLARMRRTILLGGTAQVVLTIAVAAGAAQLVTGVWGKSIFVGFLTALSSTAIVLRLLGERAQLSAPYGQVSLGVLLFQDLCIVPLMLLTPFLAGQGTGFGELAVTLLKALGVVAGVVFASRRIVPAILASVVRTRSRELFLTLLLVLCLGTAWATSLAGLSLALGAFLAGLAISESEYSHQALAEAIPFRDAFGSLFFISIGMLMNVGFVVRHLPAVVAVVLLLIVLKLVAAGAAARVLGYPKNVALRVGFTLAQIGEFAFVLSRTGVELELLGPDEYQMFLAASVVSMIATPGLIALGLRLSERMPSGHEPRIPSGADAEHAGAGALSEHVIIAGYGVNGQNLARALGAAEIPYVILEMNPETVRSARERGEPIHFGDCTRAAVLESLGIERARMYVVAISDAPSTRQSVSLARTLNPNVYVLVRTRFVAEMEELRRLGANEVIPEEFETSVEIFARVLHRFQVPRNVILDLVGRVRGDMYEMLRSPGAARPTGSGFLFGVDDAHVETVLVRSDSPVTGKRLLDLDLRARTGVLVVAVRRRAESVAPPPPEFMFESGDVMVLYGQREAIDAALVMVDPSAPVA